MPADLGDAEAVFGVVSDATALLDWCAGSDSGLEDDTGRWSPVLAPDLAVPYRAAVDQARVEAFELALRTLRGDNQSFSLQQVLAVLELAGWTGALRDFKLAVLDRSGRPEVMEVASQGRGGGGRIIRRVFRGLLGPLNAALDSLDGIPGVGVIKELKDFLEGAEAASAE